MMRRKVKKTQIITPLESNNLETCDHDHHNDPNVLSIPVYASQSNKPRTVSRNSNIPCEPSVFQHQTDQHHDLLHNEQHTQTGEFHQQGYYNPTPAEMFNGSLSGMIKEPEEQYYHIPAVNDRRPKTPYDDQDNHYDKRRQPYTIENFQDDYHNAKGKVTNSPKYKSTSHQNSGYLTNNNYTYTSAQESNLFDTKDSSRNYLSPMNLFKYKKVNNVDLNPYGTEMHAMPSAAVLDRNVSGWTEQQQHHHHHHHHHADFESEEHQRQKDMERGYSKNTYYVGGNGNNIESHTNEIGHDHRERIRYRNAQPKHQNVTYSNGDDFYSNGNQRQQYPPSSKVTSNHQSNNRSRPMVISKPVKTFTNQALGSSSKGVPKSAQRIEEDKRSIITGPVINDEPADIRNMKLQNDVTREYKMMNVQDRLNNVEYFIGRLHSHRYDYNPSDFDQQLAELTLEKTNLEKEREMISSGGSENLPIVNNSIAIADDKDIDPYKDEKSSGMCKQKLVSRWRSKLKQGFNLEGKPEVVPNEKESVDTEVGKANEVAKVYNGMGKSGAAIQRYERHTEKTITRGEITEEIKTKEIFVHDSRDMKHREKQGKLKTLLRAKRESELNKYESRRITGSGEYVNCDKIADNLTDRISRNLIDYHKYINGVSTKDSFIKLKNKFRQEDKIVELDPSSDEEESANDSFSVSVKSENGEQSVQVERTVSGIAPTDPFGNLTQNLKAFTSSFYPAFNMIPILAPILGLFNLLYSLVPPSLHIVVVTLELGTFALLTCMLFRLYSTLSVIMSPLITIFSSIISLLKYIVPIRI